MITRARRERRIRRLLPLALVPVGLAASLVVVPAAQAGLLPSLVRRPAPSAHLTDTGPDATAYPYRPGSTPSLDDYGFVAGQCTSFVAWWLNTRGLPFGVVTVGPGGTGWFLYASSWDGAARQAGYGVGSRPVVGAIAQWRAGESSRWTDPDGTRHTVTAGRPGHVAIVVRVLPDGEAVWLDYGWSGLPQLHRGRGFAPRYLYLGVVAGSG
jgi:surface antigen